MICWSYLIYFFYGYFFFLYKGFSANTVKGGMRISENYALTLKSSSLSLDKGFRAVRVRYTLRCLPILSCFFFPAHILAEFTSLKSTIETLE